MPRNKWTPKQVQDWTNQSSNNNSNGGSGGSSGNTIGNPAVGARIDSGPIGTYGLHKGVNLKATDPDWKEHFHEIMDMFGNIPVVGSLFSAINAGVYIAEGNAAGAAGALANVVLDFIPGGGEAASSVKVASDMGKLAEESGVKLGEQEIEKGAEQVVEKQAEKQGEKQTETETETETDKENDKENEKQNGGNAIQQKRQACKNSKGVGHPVNPVTGVKFLSGDEDLDFALPAGFPLHWQRSYFSDLASSGWLGQGWSLPFSLCLKRVGHAVLLVDAQGYETCLPTLGLGECKTIGNIRFDVCRETHGRYCFTSTDRSKHFVFALLTVGADDRTGQHAGILPLVGIGDRHGNHMRLLYDDAGFPRLIHDAAGRVLQLQYTRFSSADGGTGLRLQRVMLGTHALVSYDYSADGDLMRVRNAEGQITREYRYNNHILIEHSQPGALIARYEYDQYTSSGKVLRLENNVGQSWQFRYLPDRTEVTDALGQTQNYLFNDQQMVVGQVDATGNTTRMDLDGRGNQVRVTDPAGRLRVATYDAHGNMTSVTDAAGGRTDLQYHPQWQRPTLVTDAMGAATRFAYDGTGSLIRRTDALGHATEYAYDDGGRVIRITDAHGKHRHFEYDVCGQLTSHIDCSGQMTRYSWDDWGHLASVIDAAGETTRYWRNPKGLLLRIRRPDGSSEDFTYDIHGRLIAHTDAQGALTRWVRAADGLPVTRIDALGHRRHYAYDAARRLQTLTNENGAHYRFTYDAAGHLVEQQGFDGRVICYRYDASGLLTEQRELGTQDDHANPDRDHSDTLLTTYGYDGAGRVRAATITRAGDGHVEHSTWQYDAAGRLIEACNDCCRLERGYDVLGQLTSETSHVAGQTLALTYEHDALGNHIRTTLPDGRHVDYLYYGPGHLHQINIDGELISDIERDALHREVSRTQGQLVSHYQYDRGGRLAAHHTVDRFAATVQAAPVISRTYAYDRVGNVQRVTDLDSGARRYEYDPLGQLIKADCEAFAFDPAHNLLDTGGPPAVIDNRVMQFGQQRYIYDAHGNVVEKSIGTRTRIHFDYSLAHRIERARIIRSGAEERVEYAYDALGRRVFKKSGSRVTLFLWEFNRLLSEMRDDRTYVYAYAHNSFVPLAQIESCGGLRGRSDRSMVIRYYHTDQVGMPLELTCVDGRVQWQARPMAWGNISRAGLADGNREAWPGQSDALAAHQPLRFQGQYVDEETGLHYNQHRYYDPDTGRFITQDPIGLRGGNNLYRYGPNPGRWIDPLGLQGANLNLAGFMASGWASSLQHSGDIFSVVSHGNPTGVTGETVGDYISASEMADKIRSTPGYRQNQTIWMIVCYAGSERDLANPQNSSYAQELSDELGQPVIAPNGPVSPVMSGNMAYTTLPSGTQWLNFSPTPYTLTHL
ncbi:MAG: RHS repeat-associated core domain-containing protein [Paraburkholderia sp.]|uniref:RHS repeat-associated core domain-containing protein n=1 Tax=Paraburkholderia sp. TaxID=1926495 RepID=UPI003C3637AE